MERVAAANERPVQICAILFGIGFFLSSLVYLFLAYWSVTQQDFWRVYEICLNHSWLESALLKFNGHSLFFPSFVWLADLRFFHGDQAFVFFASLAFLIISTWLLVVAVWRDRTLDLTTRLLAALTLVVGNFWVGRAAITTSGGFNCMNSLVMIGVAAAFLLLPKMRANAWHIGLLIVCAGFLSSFSFGTGLAIWPCLFVLAYYLRLSWRCFVLIAVSAIIVTFLYYSLPPHETQNLVFSNAHETGIVSLTGLIDYCKLIGTPVFYAVTAWQGVQQTPEVIETSGWLFWSGIAGLAIGALATVARLFRKPSKDCDLELIGLGLIQFNLGALFLIVAGRVTYFQRLPAEIAAPRYIFWSSLFWTGLILVAIHHASRRRLLRWPIAILVLALPGATWAFHRDEGLHWRYARMLSEQGATALINNVIDPDRLLFPDPSQIILLAPQLRAHRLDMFAQGFQDWVGLPLSSLPARRTDKYAFHATAHVESITDAGSKKPVVRIMGNVGGRKKRSPEKLLITDSNGIVAGIGSVFTTSDFLDRLLYGNRMTHARLVGYIRDYNPALRYELHFLGRDGISKAKIDVPSLPR
jgi:hypothetical protein